MAREATLRAILVGDARSMQKALKDVDVSMGQTEVKAQKFGDSWLKVGAGVGAALGVLGGVSAILDGIKTATIDYNKTLEQSERILFGLTKSHEETAAAMAVARSEAQKGRGGYADLAASMAGLIPISKQTGQSLQSLTETAEILAAINPLEGISGATIALANAASGDLTSLSDRFNISLKLIQKYRTEGVSDIEAAQKAMKELGYDTQFLEEANKSATQQQEVFFDSLKRMGAQLARPAFDAAAAKLGEWNKQLQSPAVQEWIKGMQLTIKVVLDSMTSWEIWGQGLKGILALAEQEVKNAIGGIVNAYNSLADKIHLPKLDMGWLDDWQAAITGRKEEVANFVRDTWGDDYRRIFAEETDKNTDQAKEGGKAVGAAYSIGLLQGFTGAELGDIEQFTKQFEDLFKKADGKPDTNAFKAASGVILQALSEIKASGEITADTFYKLTAAFGDNALNVATLTVRYGEQIAAQKELAAATKAVADQQKRQTQLANDLANDLKPYKTALDDITETEKRHATEATTALEPLQEQLEDIGDAASDAARRNAAAVDAASSALSAASEKRRREQEALAAAERGETDEYLARLPYIDEETRKVAEKYRVMVEGEYRAKTAADDRLNALNVEGRKEDLGLLKQIQAAEDAGDTRKVAALRKQLENQRKRRQTDVEVAQAEAAVAEDEFDAAKDRADKVADKADQANEKEEQGAQKRLDDIKDAAAAEAERYRLQQAGIQAEIDRIEDAAKAQAKKDAQARTDAQTNFDQQKTFNDKLLLMLGPINTLEGARVKNAQDSATAAENLYNWVAKIYGIYAANPPGSPGGPPKPEQVYPIGEGGNSPYDDSPPYVPPPRPAGPQAMTPTGQRPPLFDGITFPDPGPGGYHKEYDTSGHPWWVPDGSSLADYGKQPGSAPTPSGRGGSASLRASGTGAATGGGLDAPTLGSFNGPPLPPGAQGFTFIFNLTAPNLANMGDPKQVEALFRQSSGVARREWQQLVRGGPGRNT